MLEIPATFPTPSSAGIFNPRLAAIFTDLHLHRQIWIYQSLYLHDRGFRGRIVFHHTHQGKKKCVLSWLNFLDWLGESENVIMILDMGKYGSQTGVKL
jgi:hypothetical protein